MLEEIGASIVDPLISIYEGFINVLPGLIGAIIVLIVGYIIAAGLGYALLRVLHKIKLDKWIVEKTHIKKLAGGINLSEFLSVVTKWYIFILFLPPAADLIELSALATFLNTVALWVPHMIAAIVIALLGFLVAEYVGKLILETKTRGAEVLANVAKFTIIVVFALVVLEQIGIRVTLVQNALLIVLAGAVFAVALGAGLAFGLGGTDEAKKAINQIKKKV